MEYSTVLKTCGIAILAVTAITVIKQLRADFVPPVRVIVFLVFTSVIIALVVPVIDYITKLSASYGVAKYGDILIKVLSLTMILKLTSDVCNELGESMVANAVETICRLQLIIISIPIIDSIIDTVVGLL